MSLRGRVLRRKYSEWTMEPKSIQSQRAQLAGLLKAFHYYPTAGVSGTMPYLASYLKESGLFIGTFPYPTIYPPTMETGLPVATTQWVRFGSYWQYSGRGTRTSSAFGLAYIVVDVTTNPKQPTVKSSGTIGVNGGTAECLETIVPSATGAWMLCATNPHGTTPVWDMETITFSGNDEVYVSMAFCQQPVPLNNTACALSYYVEPEAVLQPKI